MFEQEIELEKKQSTAIPLLLVIVLIVGLVGIAGYFVVQSTRVLEPAEAAQVAAGILDTLGPTTVSFHTGLVRNRYDESASDPRYRLLEKAGVITIGKAKGDKVPVSLTARGEELLKQISGVKQKADDDGSQAYTVPLAARKLLKVSKVTMAGPEHATIEYSWKWEPNALGLNFDASGGKLSDFNSWDRVALIDKFGARFYEEPPTTVNASVARTAQGWHLATQ